MEVNRVTKIFPVADRNAILKPLGIDRIESGKVVEHFGGVDTVDTMIQICANPSSTSKI
jgi:hypothetical protein